MTTAVIYLDPQTIQPVLDGKWHRLHADGTPQTGQMITMLCGATGAAEFRPSSERRSKRINQQCEECDEEFRKQQGIPSHQHRIGR